MGGRFRTRGGARMLCGEPGGGSCAGGGAVELRFELRAGSSGAGGRRRPGAPLASLTLSSTAASAASVNGLQLLPVCSHRGGKQQQYAWDGSRVIAVNTDLLEEGYTPAGRLQDYLSRLQQSVRSSFLPRREDVTEDYWEWLRWRCAQRFFSATLQNFATQSLLMAVGVGARKALAASAAINWMLKDGMNRLVRMSVATQFGDSFDSDLKRFRFTTSLLYTACVSCEFLTPRFPSHFLLLTAVSNVGRAVGLTTFVSTQPAFQTALCASGNMADLASKTQAQHMVMDTLALAVSASANYLLRHREAQRMALPLLAFPVCGVADLFCIYHELKAVQLRSLNRERAEMVAQHWLERGRAPTFKDISSTERLLAPPDICGNLLPMRLAPLEATASSPRQLQGLLSAYRGSRYLLAVHPERRVSPWEASVVERCLGRYWTVPHVSVTLQAGAAPRDVLTAVLEAAYLRQQLQQQPPLPPQQQQQQDQQQQQQQQDQEQPPAAGCGHAQLAVQALVAEEGAGGPCSAAVRRRCKRLAERNVDRLLSDLQAGGWHVKPFHLSKSEKQGFVRS